MLKDNKTSLTLTKDRENQNWTKHIDVMHHYIQRLVEDRELAIDEIASSAMLADALTKVLPIAAFRKHFREWGFIK